MKEFFKKEPVLCVSALAAAVSCLAVPPDAEYLGYLDLRTLALLYCLMVVVSGFRQAGFFELMARRLCARAGDARTVGLILVLLCFFSSMLITNDVALLTFVPFTILVLGGDGGSRAMIGTVVLETAAANLGSMLTPVGNPQNLYLYSRYAMPAGEFFACTLPVCAVGLVLIAALCLALPRGRVEVPAGGAGLDGRTMALSGALFACCLCVVLRAAEWYVLLPVLVAALLVFDRRLLLRADFMLLLTFVCFFIFVGNVGRIGAVRGALRAALAGRELAVSALASQVISNVPAAVLLSGFTDNARGLLLGTDIGGLGTPVASLASLISLKFYARAKNARTGAYLGAFSAVNFALLALLLAFAYFVLQSP